MKPKRFLLLLWLATESILAGIGAFVLARTLLSLWLPMNWFAAFVTVGLTLVVTFASLWSHGRAEADIKRRSLEQASLTPPAP